MKVWAGVTGLLVLCACAMTQGNRDSPTYQAGYADGCGTANGEASGVPMPAKRNDILFMADTEYRAGWSAGHADCRWMNGPPRL